MSLDFLEVFSLRSLSFPLDPLDPLVKPTKNREFSGKMWERGCSFLPFLLGPLLQVQGQHCHLCPRGALQKKKRQNRQLLKALRKSTVATP